MKRFYSDEPDPDDEFEFQNIFNEDEEMEDEEGEAYAFIDESDLIGAMQLDIAEQELNQEMLEKAMKIAKQSWFWIFKSSSAKMSEIEFIYKKLKKIADEEEESEEEKE